MGDRTHAEQLADFLRTGDSESRVQDWSGASIVEKCRNGPDAMTTALLAEAMSRQAAHIGAAVRSALKFLVIVDEFSGECLAVEMDRKIQSEGALHQPTKLFSERGTLIFTRSDNRPELGSTAVRERRSHLGVGPLFIEPGSPWENGCVESFNGKQRDELLDREICDILWESRVLIERWR